MFVINAVGNPGFGDWWGEEWFHQVLQRIGEKHGGTHEHLGRRDVFLAEQVAIVMVLLQALNPFG